MLPLSRTSAQGKLPHSDPEPVRKANRLRLCQSPYSRRPHKWSRIEIHAIGIFSVFGTAEYRMSNDKFRSADLTSAVLNSTFCIRHFAGPGTVRTQEKGILQHLPNVCGLPGRAGDASNRSGWAVSIYRFLSHHNQFSVEDLLLDLLGCRSGLQVISLADKFLDRG